MTVNQIPRTAAAPVGEAAAFQDAVREYFVFVLGALRAHWKLLLAPIAITLGLAFLASMLVPKTYISKSLILFQSANRTAGSGPLASALDGQAALEQIQAVEAWLKSDQVLFGLLPQLADAKDLDTPDKQVGQADSLRRALTLELVGGSVLEISLTGGRPEGLGNRLEIILARLMEGLTGPEQGIFNAPQFILMRRSQTVEVAETALNKAVAQVGQSSPDRTLALLRQLYDMKQQDLSLAAPKTDALAPDAATLPTPVRNEPTIDTKAIRAAISNDPAVVATLENAFADFATASKELDASRSRLPSRGNNYVGIFNSPENLLIVGRPKDPITGESAIRKIALAGLMFSFGLGLAMTFLAERLDRRLKTQDQFKRATGLRVIARLGKVAAH